MNFKNGQAKVGVYLAAIGSGLQAASFLDVFMAAWPFLIGIDIGIQMVRHQYHLAVVLGVLAVALTASNVALRGTQKRLERAIARRDAWEHTSRFLARTAIEMAHGNAVKNASPGTVPLRRMDS